MTFILKQIFFAKVTLILKWREYNLKTEGVNTRETKETIISNFRGKERKGFSFHWKGECSRECVLGKGEQRLKN